MKNIYYLLLLPLLACSNNNNNNEMQTGGDHIFIESAPYQTKVVLELEKSNDSSSSSVSTYFLKYYDSDYEKADTMYFEPLINNVDCERGIFYIWISDIDKGSMGPFTRLLDTGIVFIESTLRDSIYEFRCY